MEVYCLQAFAAFVSSKGTLRFNLQNKPFLPIETVCFAD